MRLPDFIIGGAPRSGTTWLYELLDRHPEIYMAKPIKPEPKYFLVDELYERGLTDYARWFDDAESGQITGEKSTNYLENPLVASRIKHDLPRVKLIFILRDPVSRAYSNYLWSKMNGLETLDFDAALDKELERERDISTQYKYARPHAYYSRGLYAKMLIPYYDQFKKEQILCLKYEDIVKNSNQLVGILYTFLGVQQRVGDLSKMYIVNSSNATDVELNSEDRRGLINAYSEPNKHLATLLGPEFKVWKYLNEQ